MATAPMLDDYGVESASIERRRKLADMMLQGGLSPLEQPGTPAGGFTPHISPVQGLAKMLQAYVGARGNQQADAQMRALGYRMRDQAGQQLSDFQAAQAPTPGAPAMPAQNFAPSDDAGSAGAMVPGTPEGAPTPPSRQAQLAAALKLASGGNPLTAPMGSKLAEELLKPASADALLRRQTSLETHAAPSGGDLMRDTRSRDQFGQVSGNTAATLAQGQQHWMGVSPYQQQTLAQGAQGLGLRSQANQIAGGHLANEGSRLNFETGVAPAGVPRLGMSTPPPAAPQAPGMPPMAPAGPVAAPQGVSQAGPAVPQAAPQPVSAPRVSAAFPERSAVTPKVLAEREAQRPQATQARAQINTFADNVLKDVDELLGDKGKGHAGLSGVTGPIFGAAPSLSVSGKSTTAQAVIDALMSKLSIQELQAMRESSKTGGAVGQVTEAEWPRLAAAVSTLGQRQTTGEYVKHLNDLKTLLTTMKANSNGAYEMTYGRRGSDAKAPTAPSAPRVVDW